MTLVGYKRFLSPMLPSACRFHPTCSEYMREAVELHGAASGAWLGLKRLVRCQPFCKGGLDPVPPPKGHACQPASSPSSSRYTSPN
ncbi:MAG: membrane protein insertion efficiency factor YidD [Bryobacterales bacterium]|nr:membrane protein insertion efficiency factor YidD [Bryobacterales bacterium]